MLIIARNTPLSTNLTRPFKCMAKDKLQPRVATRQIPVLHKQLTNPKSRIHIFCGVSTTSTLNPQLLNVFYPGLAYHFVQVNPPNWFIRKPKNYSQRMWSNIIKKHIHYKIKGTKGKQRKRLKCYLPTTVLIVTSLDDDIMS